MHCLENNGPTDDFNRDTNIVVSTDANTKEVKQIFWRPESDNEKRVDVLSIEGCSSVELGLL